MPQDPNNRWSSAMLPFVVLWKLLTLLLLSHKPSVQPDDPQQPPANHGERQATCRQ